MLEQAIQENTAAINKLIAILSAAQPFNVEAATAAAKKAAKDAADKRGTRVVTAPEPKPEAPVAQVEQSTAEAKPAESTAETPKTAAPVLTYKGAADKITAVVRKFGPEAGRTKAKEILAKFGVGHGNELKAEQYADVIAECDKVLA